MILLKSSQRGHYNHGWLETFHSFSFADYYNPKMMNFESLRVINDDKIAAQNGFDFHPHSNMEIITYILEGTLTHADNLGNKEQISEGQIQVMSAGKGIIHSEFNHDDVPCHLLQIWIKPNQIGGEPYYKISNFDAKNKFALIASNSHQGSSIAIRQAAEIYIFEGEKNLKIDLPKNSFKKIWIQIGAGEVNLESASESLNLKRGDGIGFDKNENNFSQIEVVQNCKLIIFYL